MEEMLKEVENCNGASAFCACVHAKTLILLISIWIYCLIELKHPCCA